MARAIPDSASVTMMTFPASRYSMATSDKVTFDENSLWGEMSIQKKGRGVNRSNRSDPVFSYKKDIDILRYK